MIHDEDHDRSLVHRTDVGWADGSAWTALFGYPVGIAVSRDGREVVIADTSNHALRRLRGNMHFVERLAGRPRRAGRRDGPAEQALLDRPRDPELIDGAVGHRRDVDNMWVEGGEDYWERHRQRVEEAARAAQEATV